MLPLISGCGYVVMIGLAWLLSSHRWRVSLRVVLIGSLLQFALAYLILRTSSGQAVFAGLGQLFENALSLADAGARMVFGYELPPKAPVAFLVLPNIIVFSALMAVLYYIGVMQRLVQAMGWLMRITLGTSGAESLIAAANIFIGQTAAPLVARPYLEKMTDSELMALMVTGFATVAGSVMAAYIGMGIPAAHLLAASVISAPAALLIAKVMQPEVDTPLSLGGAEVSTENPGANFVHAITRGAAEGLQLALSVGAMLIAFVALVAMLNGVIGAVGDSVKYYGDGWLRANFGLTFSERWSLQLFCGYLFWPVAWIMGVESKDCYHLGQLLGLRFVTNEFVSFDLMGQWMRDPAHGVSLSPRTINLATYAMCGFANLGSIGVQVGGLGPIMPSREGDLARLGFRAMLGGTLASFMTACVAGVLL